jgi:hypothetical protein
LHISKEKPRKCKNLANSIVIFAEKVKKNGEIGEGWGEIFKSSLAINSFVLKNCCL